MKKKFQVFISSTYKDLKDERSTLLHALLSRGDVIPAGMELFPASNKEPWSHIKTVIEESDYYISVLGGCYGSEIEGESYTQKEFNFARASNTPILAFLRNLEGLDSSIKDEGERLQKQEGFRKDVESYGLAKFWTNSADLVAAVLTSLGNLIQDHPREGWIRGNDVLSPSQALVLREENDVLKKQIADLQVVPKAGIENLADGEDVIKLSFKTQRGYDKEISLTWNEIKSEIGPDLFAPKYDYQFLQMVNRLLRTKSGQNVGSGTEAIAKIKMQLLALGTIKDVGRVPMKAGGYASLWELTPKGRIEVSQLLAEKKPETLLDTLAKPRKKDKK